MAMVRDLALDEDGDIAVVNGDFATVADLEAVPQGIAIRVRFFFGECWLDESIGVMWLEKILGVKGADPLLVRELIREAIADTPDVTDTASSDLVNDAATRRGRVAYAAATRYTSELVTREVLL